MTGNRERWHGFALALALAGLAAGCGGGGGGDGPGIVNAPVVIAVTVSQPISSSIDITGTVQLSANVEVQNGASQNVDWTSSALNVATVSPVGVVTGVAAGQTTITATSTANRSKTGSVTITVNPPRVVAVTLSLPAQTIRVGQNFQVAATVETRGALARTVTFTTSSPSSATVTSTDGLTGTVTGVGAGATTITATSTADPTKSVTLSVTVTGTVRITSVTPSPVNIRQGTSVKLVPTVQADAGITPAVQFVPQNAAIASVASDGTVTGVSFGQTGVVVRSVGDPTVSVTVPVTVRSGVTSVSLTPDRDSVRRGGTRQLTVGVVVEAGVLASINTSSANPAVATMDITGRVTGVANGQTYVRAFSSLDPSVIDSTLITVLDPCAFFIPLAPSVITPGTVTDISCNGLSELYSLNVTQQTTFAMTATPAFPMEFTVLGDRDASWFTTGLANANTTAIVVAAPNRYFLRVSAQSINQRGAFNIVAVPGAQVTGACNVVATTGITVTASLNICGFVPQNRPAGNYNSVSFPFLPSLVPGAQITVTVTAPAGVFPLVEVRFGTNPPVQAIGTGTTLVQTFTAPAPPGTAGLSRVTVSTRDALQAANMIVKLEGPPTIAFDAFVFGSGVLQSRSRAPLAAQKLP